jgi:hypothetical protein
MFDTKDSGRREEYDSGMVRDTQEGKPRFDLLHPVGVPYPEQMLTRFAELMARGADKYGDRNWEKARGQEELERYYSSAERHLEQWIAGETDEDHAAAVMFNVLAGETVRYHMRQQPELRILPSPVLMGSTAYGGLATPTDGGSMQACDQVASLGEQCVQRAGHTGDHLAYDEEGVAIRFTVVGEPPTPTPICGIETCPVCPLE